MSNQRFRVTWFKNANRRATLSCKDKKRTTLSCRACNVGRTNRVSKYERGNLFQPQETTAAPQEELLAVDENDKGDSDINIDD